MLTIRPANLADAQAIQVIYAPYVEKTAITLNMKFPVFKNLRIVSIKPLKLTLIWSLKRMDKFSDMPMLQPTMPGQLIIGQLNCPSICMKMPVVEVWEVSSMMLLKRNLNNGAFCDS